jgi:acyl-CoA synthetase (NDP forming)
MAELIDLEPLFRPLSVAIVGASPQPSVGRYIFDTLSEFGFVGDVYPVNPRYEAIDETPCYRSLDDLPGHPDVVAFCVPPNGR